MKPVARMPIYDGAGCTATFIFTLAYLVLGKLILRCSKTRKLNKKDHYPLSSRYLKEVPAIEIFLKVLNFLYIYKLIKTFREFRYVISITRLASRFTGFVCKCYVPVCLRAPFYGSFGRFYGVKMEEAEIERFDHYRDFTAFFTRRLKKDARIIDQPNDINTMCSPCDGRVMSFGDIGRNDSNIDCVKGRSYRLDEFMTGTIGNENDESSTHEKLRDGKTNSGVDGLLEKVYARGNKLCYMVVYLGPGDYHRFHSPAIHTADYRRHIVGYLAPVKPDYIAKHPNTFATNERVNIFGEWRGEEKNFFFVSYVGALNVGSICLDFDTDVVTNEAFPKMPPCWDKAYTLGHVNPLQSYHAK